jgi:hypothetical protein
MLPAFGEFGVSADEFGSVIRQLVPRSSHVEKLVPIPASNHGASKGSALVSVLAIL